MRITTTFASIIILIFSLVFISCEKESSNDKLNSENQNEENTIHQRSNRIDEFMSYYYQQARNNTSRGPFEDIWNWMVSHSGTHSDCGYDLNLPCGLCPGICIGVRFTPVDDDYLLNQEEYENGKRLLEIGFFNDSTLGVNFKHKGFVENDTLFVDQDYNIGDEASELYNKDSIIIEKGAYPVTYSQSKNGSTIVDIKSY